MADREDIGLAKSAKDLINQLAAIIRTASIHDPSNVAVVSAVEKMASLVNAMLASSTGPVTLELLGDYFYLNDARVKVSAEHLINLDYLTREFKRHKLGSIVFQNAAASGEMLSFVKAFIASSFYDDPFESLSSDIAGLKSIAVGAPRHVIEEPEEVDVRKMVKKTYFNAVSFTKGVMNKIKSGEKLNVKKAKRVVESLVDKILEQEELLLGMTAIKDYDDYTYHHSVNVSILAVALGQRLGLSRSSLLELGVVSLFHDIGKTDVPPEVLNKATPFTEEEWRLVKKHPLWGVRAILKMKKPDPISVQSAIVAFEHHVHADGTGYPARRNLSELDLFSRIVGIADQYDGMTSSRVYARTPMPPDKALSLMMERSGSQLDPLLLKFFVNMVGVFPVGSLVMLDTHELGLVFGGNAATPDRPKVLVIVDPQGKRVQPPYIVDLTEKIDETHFKRAIAKTLDPNKYRINLAEYLL